MPLTRRGSVEIHYQEQGDAQAPPLLLVMGLALSSRAWDRLPGLLSPHFRVITFDNRGTGRSGHGWRPYRMGALADDAVAVLDACGVFCADVCGISMGGMIAQEIALRHPHRVRRLALGCTHASFLRSHKPPLSGLFGLLGVLARQPPDLRRLGRLLVSEEFLSAPHAQEELARWRRGADQGRARGIALQQQLLAIGLHSTHKRLPQLRHPTLILTGDRDRLVDARESKRLQRLIPDARLLVFKGAGHVFPLEREQETVRALLDHFLGAPALEQTA
jgi:pimeloyl-ACP methyl ester carboxylesterase